MRLKLSPKKKSFKLIAILLMGFLLSGCLQTMKLTAVDNRNDLRFTQWVKGDGTVAKSYHQLEVDGNWYEAERKNGVWGLSEMGRMDYQQSKSGSGGGGGGGCGS